jgi:tetratricopeptide (TPR) repeat protein
MAELRRTDPAIHGADPDRDGRVEALLVEGLDRYFVGRYEEAVHIWTRVLFLDRTHPRARAYIDRARTALAERQRRSDELLHTSQFLLDQGKTDDARLLLSEAMAESGDDERAATLRMRLDRLERARIGAPSTVPPRVSALPAWVTDPAPRAVKWTLIGVTFVVCAWLLARLAMPIWQPATAPDAPSVLRSAGVTTLTSSDVALVRAKTLYGRGRLAEALQVLERVSLESPLRPEADRLHVEIQRLLLAAGTPASTVSGRLH